MMGLLGNFFTGGVPRRKDLSLKAMFGWSFKRNVFFLVLVLSVFEIGNINFVYAETYGSQIDSVMDDRRHYDVMADNVYQQISNGGYRTVDMLAIIARELDGAGSYGSQIDSVMDDRRHYDVMANNVYQQISNGRYRTVDMLAVIAHEKDI